MIPARPLPLFHHWFLGHARKRLRHRFSCLRISGLEEARALVAEGPVLAIANHSAWWDPLVVLVVADLLGARGEAMMDARHLARLPFFRLLGGFGVDLSRPQDGARALRYAARRLRAPGELVIVFPQGEERPEDPRPLGFKAGAALLARLAPAAAVLPIAIRYRFCGAEDPELHVFIGAPLPAVRELEEGRRAQEAAVEALLAQEPGEALWSREPGLLNRGATAILVLLSRLWLGRRVPSTGGDPRGRSGAADRAS